VARLRDLAARLRRSVAAVPGSLRVAVAASRRLLTRFGDRVYLDLAAARDSFWEGVAGFGVLLVVLAASGLVIGGIAVLLRALVA
jgi:hypothetical protein